MRASSPRLHLGYSDKQFQKGRYLGGTALAEICILEVCLGSHQKTPYLVCRRRPPITIPPFPVFCIPIETCQLDHHWC